MAATSKNVPLEAVRSLGYEWHDAGTVHNTVLDAIVRHAGDGFSRSVETGTGRTTLLFSHLSAQHTVFTLGEADGGGSSQPNVASSSLLSPSTTDFVLGPTQRTILQHDFSGAPIDCAYLDGPHAWPFPELEYWAVYPHLREGSLLIIDDVNIPTIANMFEILNADAMYETIDVVDSTAFFRRTAAPMVDPFGEGFWMQGYNARRRSGHLKGAQRALAIAKQLAPDGLKDAVKRRVR